ncbi:MAG TPA: phytanoyl-CoA dioxygenase family protein [Candidatus Eisenbacteria bacterium]|nr:phytanoyl-CoA dioxygenase family protein [Candidatus Eisenbacteria bacterium]
MPPVPTAARFLSQEESLAFDRDGFLVVRGVFSAEEIRQVSGWIDQLASAKSPKWLLYEEPSLTEKGKKLLSRVEQFADHHGPLGRFIRDERIVRRASELLGEPAVLFKEKVNFKMPGAAGFRAHQDIQPAGWEAYADYFISALIAVDPSTPENGCLELAAGHHKRGWLGGKGKPLDGPALEGVDFVKYPMEPGDAVYFDCFVPHRSGPNLTARPRRNLYLTFNRGSEGDQRERYFVDWRRDLALRRFFPFLSAGRTSWRLKPA